MGPPGGGRNPVTSRFLRHFNICTINSFSDETMVRIFSTIVAFYLRNNEFAPEFFTIGNQIVSGTMEVRNKYFPESSIFYYLVKFYGFQIDLTDDIRVWEV